MATYRFRIVDYIPWIVTLSLGKLARMTTPASKTLQTLGKNLLRLRKASGYSQERLALDAEIDRTYVSQIERGIANPSMLVLKKIADCLHVQLCDLVENA